jgi:hypothetical protein
MSIIHERLFNDSLRTSDISEFEKRYINIGYQSDIASSFWEAAATKIPEKIRSLFAS